jgi:hypothetical protein
MMVRASILTLAIILGSPAAPVWAQSGAAQAPPAPEQMTRQQLRDAVTRLRAVVQNGGVTPQRPAGCVTPETRQFDFWLGEWDVSATGSTIVVAESSITSHDQGCVMLEYWRPFRGAHGHSINSYDTTDQKWHQTWVDATGRRTEYAGTFHDDVMYLDNLSGPPPGAPQGTRARMNYQRIDENTVRQWGENFDQAANEWKVSWDLTYHRRAGTR